MNTPGILLSIDFEKPFDSLNWNFLMKTLFKDDFSNRFISFIKTMYNITQSAVINNGHISDFLHWKEESDRDVLHLHTFLY